MESPLPAGEREGPARAAGGRVRAVAKPGRPSPPAPLPYRERGVIRFHLQARLPFFIFLGGPSLRVSETIGQRWPSTRIEPKLSRLRPPRVS